ncbi:hypothetical protein BLD46_12720 [Erwinia sp. OLMTSP26]|nr:hypothetical protein BLD46_12720 [Erwinia sp. OLMTSP26]
MNEAMAYGMSIGKDIIFTFGPYASIYTQTYHPATDQLMIWGSLYFAISFAIAVWLNFRVSRWPLKIVILAVLSALIYSRDALFFFYPMLVGIQIYRWVSAFDTKQTTTRGECSLIVALFSPFGLLPLIKGSTLIACVAISFFSIVLLAKRRQWKLSLLIVASFLISTVIFWALSGQPLSGLADYFISLAPIISGYTEAMAINGDLTQCILYIVATATMAGFLFYGIQGGGYDKSVVTLVFLCILFLSFKAGFVRHDSHMLVCASMILLGASLAGTLLSPRSALAVIVVSLITWGYIDVAYIKNPVDNVKYYFINRFSNSWDGLKQRTLEPQALTKYFEERVNLIKKRGPIPKLNGTVDIYSYDQAYLFASGNTWNPRPIFQSYSAYTPQLAELNKKHLLAVNRPDNIILNVQPIDERLPSLEDGASWPVLLSNYQPTSFAGSYLYLKHRDTPPPTSKPSEKIGGGFYSFGDTINLPDSHAPIFAKLTINKSFAGSILNMLFKTSQLQMKLTMQNGVTRSYRIIPGMTESGFIISPLIENTAEFWLLSVSANHLKDKRVKSIEISATNLPFLWKKSFNIEFYALNYPSSPGDINLQGLAKPQPENFKKTTFIQQCNGHIDTANGAPPSSGLIQTSTLLNVQGWLVTSVTPAQLPDKVYVMLSDADGKRYLFNTQRMSRPDVGAYFKQPLLDSSGYVLTADVSKLNGDYRLGLAYSSDNELFICPQFDDPVKISRE